MTDHIESFALTDIGKRRSHNEDSIYRSDDLGLYLVADGMGGHAHGEVASALAIETVLNGFDGQDRHSPSLFLRERVQAANSEVFMASSRNVELEKDGGTIIAGMGTTLVALYRVNDLAIIAHVGDSRAYRLRQSQLNQLTKDHSLVARLAEEQHVSPDQVKTGFRNVLIRGIGLEPTVEVDLLEEKTEPNDIYLLCSDGLTNMVDDSKIQEILSLDLPLEIRCERLIQEANQAGGLDNISCVLVQSSL